MTSRWFGRHIGRYVGALSLVLGGCSLEPETAATATASDPIIGGSGDVRPGSDAVVFLGDCSGVLVNAHTLLTAEHCLPVETAAPVAVDADAPAPQPAETVRLAVRRGPRAETCLTPARGGICDAWELKIVRQPASDLVALRSQQAFVGVVAADLPVVRDGFEPATAYVHGYGISGPDTLGVRLSAAIRVDEYRADYAYGRTAPGVRVCGGDSGGPLFGEAPSGGLAAIIGVLSATEIDPSDPRCTAAAGLNRFARVDRAFVQAAAGPCIDTAGTLDCRLGGTSDVRTQLAALAGTTAAPDVLDELRAAGIEIIDPAGVSAERIDSEGLVGVSTDQGNYLARLPATGEPATPAGAAASRGDGGDPGELVPLAVRGVSLSGNGDQRRRQFVLQSGGINTTSSTAAPICTGTLIGARIVRTAKHCIKQTPRPWFTARYDGGPTTWTVPGTSSHVTFNPRLADFHFFGGNYFNFGCQSGVASDACIAQDWALIIMPADVWQPVHFVPAFMGYSTTQTVAVTNAGYPRCADISSPNISSCHTGLMYGMSCSVVVNYGSHYYSNCDASGGHSGSGTFFTSAGTRYLIGNLKGGPSNAACPNGTCTTYDSGTSSWLFDFQSEMRNTYFALTF